MATEAFRGRVQRRDRSSLEMIGIIARRDLRDTLRDWRMVSPVVILTLIFPWLMNWTAQLAIDYVERQQAAIIGERMIPFLLMIVGFFPISFSLVIALETFVGEKERRSIEPLLSMPITDLELYLGKMLAASALPLLGSTLGITVYLGGLYLSIGYEAPLQLLLQIYLLTVIEGVVMVSGAVVVSSQTTSVRSANLLASFIVIPVALLVQAESLIMFWADYSILWVISLGLAVVAMILIRMGVKTFNREEILGREIDELNPRHLGRLAHHFFVQPPYGMGSLRAETEPVPPARSLVRWVTRVYRHDLPYLMRHNWMAVAVVVFFLVVAGGIGWAYVDNHPLPQGVLRIEDITKQDFDSISDVGFLPSLTTGGILGHNVQALILAGLVAVISLGVLSILLLMVPIALVGFFAGQMAWLGYSPLIFFAAFVLPHGIFEIPAAVIATAFALRLGASVTSLREGLTVGEGLIAAGADFCKAFVFLVVPLLLISAFVEANLTPEIIVWLYGPSR
jgi:uncharacterized membrane protein SpoIIM required for sporulation/ABC-type transport system involved in multi-copper enzyme maturation permease subunit